MNKKCPICHKIFTDNSGDGRHDYCLDCESEWDGMQVENLGLKGLNEDKI